MGVMGDGTRKIQLRSENGGIGHWDLKTYLGVGTMSGGIGGGGVDS